jgi:endonuclease/exonuclease/phosphatase family metal-dependent hydrolase
MSKLNTGIWVVVGLLAVTIVIVIYIVNTSPEVDNLDFVEVGWWNIRDFSTSSRNDNEIDQIASIIDTDLMAIGELNETRALESLTNAMGSNWAWAATGKKVGKSAWSAEYYGFIWNEEHLTLLDSIHIFRDLDNDFDRDPAWATFKTVDGNLDFTVIAVHVTWGDRVGPRKAEVMAMKKVYLYVQKATSSDNDIIVVGDFNRNKNDASFDSLLSINGMIRANESTGPTHISGTTTYDQIFISTDYTKEWTGESVTVHFDETNFNTDEEAKLVASDHRPVWIRLYIPDKDDD